MNFSLTLPDPSATTHSGPHSATEKLLQLSQDAKIPASALYMCRAFCKNVLPPFSGQGSAQASSGTDSLPPSVFTLPCGAQPGGAGRGGGGPADSSFSVCCAGSVRTGTSPAPRRADSASEC